MKREIITTENGDKILMVTAEIEGVPVTAVPPPSVELGEEDLRRCLGLELNKLDILCGLNLPIWGGRYTYALTLLSEGRWTLGIRAKGLKKKGFMSEVYSWESDPASDDERPKRCFEVNLRFSSSNRYGTTSYFKERFRGDTEKSPELALLINTLTMAAHLLTKKEKEQ